MTLIYEILQCVFMASASVAMIVMAIAAYKLK